MNTMYNEKKLTPIFEIMKNKSVLVVGCGAIGSMIAEHLTRNSTGIVTLIDKDVYEAGNIPKSSAIIRYPEDIGVSKAIALSTRLNAVANDGCKIYGYHYDLKKIGPMALSAFDYVVLALDNTSMKIFASKLLKMCPEDKRPICLSCGTNGEFSEAMIFSNTGACLRCTIPDAWLKSENPETVWSCAEKVNYLLPEKMAPIVSTSGIASMKAAIDIDDMITAHATKAKTFEESTRRVQFPYPMKDSSETVISHLKECPVCGLTPPEDVIKLPGGTATSTLRELLQNIGKHFTEKFRLRVHTLTIPNLPEQVYSQFVFTNRCECGKSYPIAKHTGFVRKDQIQCPYCGKGADEVDTIPDVTSYFSLEGTPDSVLDYPLIDLGYPIGAYYEAESIVDAFNGREEDIPFDGFDLVLPKTIFFSLTDDENYLIHYEDEQNEMFVGLVDEYEIEVCNPFGGAKCMCKVFPNNTLREILDVCKNDLGLANCWNYVTFEFDRRVTSDPNVTVAEFRIADGGKLLIYPR